MKVLFASNYTYKGRNMSRYVFEDEFGDLILVSQAKLVDRETNTVILFLKTTGNTENIQYSYSTARRLGLDFNHLSVPNTELAGI